jgi:hypothetical protein
MRVVGTGRLGNDPAARAGGDHFLGADVSGKSKVFDPCSVTSAVSVVDAL